MSKETPSIPVTSLHMFSNASKLTLNEAKKLVPKLMKVAVASGEHHFPYGAYIARYLNCVWIIYGREAGENVSEKLYEDFLYYVKNEMPFKTTHTKFTIEQIIEINVLLEEVE